LAPEQTQPEKGVKQQQQMNQAVFGQTAKICFEVSL
jgi:hypothetical protein